MLQKQHLKTWHFIQMTKRHTARTHECRKDNAKEYYDHGSDLNELILFFLPFRRRKVFDIKIIIGF